MLKAINKALADGMKMPEVKEALRKCGYDITVTTEANEALLELMAETPEDPNESWADVVGASRQFLPDGADFFDMAKRGVGIYRRATIRKLWNPNFVSAMSKLGSPLEDRR
tara:strand:+ start:80 stop:412 length:333 start_codon:yes stop_codon:yes gene_type:complete